jgi:cell division protein ZapB
MKTELLDILDERVGLLVQRYAELKSAHALLQEENERLLREREEVRIRVDALLARIDGV